MGNGAAELKKAAEFVTTDIHDDGVKNGLIHFGLIRQKRTPCEEGAAELR
jgi:hydroxymethylpyrimidine pyrophosphatase-like HAD family hydrolase